MFIIKVRGTEVFSEPLTSIILFNVSVYGWFAKPFSIIPVTGIINRKNPK
jgi:hypothetical protein